MQQNVNTCIMICSGLIPIILAMQTQTYRLGIMYFLFVSVMLWGPYLFAYLKLPGKARESDAYWRVATLCPTLTGLSDTALTCIPAVNR